MSDEKWGNLSLGDLSSDDLMNSRINTIVANKQKAKDSNWRERHRAGIHKRNDNEEWKKNSAAVGHLGATDEIKILNSINHTGLGNPSSKGYTIGTNVKTGEEIIFVSAKDMKVAGFHHSHVYSAIKSGKSHKGYTWRREPI